MASRWFQCVAKAENPGSVTRIGVLCGSPREDPLAKSTQVGQEMHLFASDITAGQRSKCHSMSGRINTHSCMQNWVSRPFPPIGTNQPCQVKEGSQPSLPTTTHPLTPLKCCNNNNNKSTIKEATLAWRKSTQWKCFPFTSPAGSSNLSLLLVKPSPWGLSANYPWLKSQCGQALHIHYLPSSHQACKAHIPIFILQMATWGSLWIILWKTVWGGGLGLKA